MSEKWWAVLFGVVMIGCGALFVVAPIVGWWMPNPESSHGKLVDDLFYQILFITGFFFVLTEGLLVAFMYLYTQREPGAVRGPSPLWYVFKPLANLFNTSYKIEMAWTVVPAIILVYVAVAQVDTWADVKYKSRLIKSLDKKDAPMPVVVDLSARQFEWRFRYPNPNTTWKEWQVQWQKSPEKTQELIDNWVRTPNFDDVYVPNELHMIMQRHVVVMETTKDVIHSFNMPHMRVKQDALPGKIMPIWFKPVDSNVTRLDKDGKPLARNSGKPVRWEDGGGLDPETGNPKDRSLVWQIACAELCGWGHYRMIGRGYVHEDEDDFVAWLQSAAAHQNNFGK